MGRTDDAGEHSSVARLTKSIVEAVPRPAPGERAVLWDTEVKGFGVRVTSAGKRTYVLRYRMGGRDTPRRFVTIGQHGSPWTADQARRRALELLTQVRSGVDPVEERAKINQSSVADAERCAARMFDVLADRWFEQHVKGGGLRSEKDIEGVLKRDLKSAFAGKSIDEIGKEEVSAALRTIGARSPDAANKAFKWGRQAFNWFIEQGVCGTSPFDRMKRPYPEGRRTRVLPLPELVVVWVALDALSPPFRALYRLLILLGQRLREVADMPWAELTMDDGDWLIPSTRTKNKRDHIVPLPDQALELLEALRPDLTRRKGPVITTNGTVGISGFSKLKEQVDELVLELIAGSETARELVGDGLADWVAHDLRRSLGTGCQAMGVPLAATEAILNHVSGTRGGIAGVYQLHEYYDEKADALQRWADLLERAVACFREDDVAGVRALDPARRTKRSRRRRGGPEQPDPGDETIDRLGS